MKAHPSLRVPEIICGTNIEYLVQEGAISLLVKLIITSIGGVAHMAILHVGKQIQHATCMKGCLGESRIIILACLRVIISVSCEILYLSTIGHVSEITEMTAAELL